MPMQIFEGPRGRLSPQKPLRPRVCVLAGGTVQCGDRALHSVDGLLKRLKEYSQFASGCFFHVNVLVIQEHLDEVVKCDCLGWTRGTGRYVASGGSNFSRPRQDYFNRDIRENATFDQFGRKLD